MKVKGIAWDSRTNTPVVVLVDAKDKRILPIWIGQFEANAIIMELSGISVARPMTHDLIKNLLGQMDIKVEKVIIDDLKENTYYAKIFLAKDDTVLEVDARPSDAIALALRTKAPVYLATDVADKATMIEGPIDEEEMDEVRELFKNIRPEDFQEQ